MTLKFPIIDDADRADDRILYWDATAGIHKYKDEAGGAPAFVGASVTHSAAQNLNNGSETTLAFDTEEYDTDAIHDTASNNGRLVIPSGKAGYYVATLMLGFTSSTNGALRAARIYTVTAGPTTTMVALQQVPDAASALGIFVSVTTRPIALVAGDYFEARSFVDGASLQVLQNAAYTPRFSCYRVG